MQMYVTFCMPLNFGNIPGVWKLGVLFYVKNMCLGFTIQA
jgi:hypothetical protein